MSKLSEVIKGNIRNEKKEVLPIEKCINRIETDKFVDTNQPMRVNIAATGRGVKAEELVIKYYDFNVSGIINRSVNFYGPSGTGKTFLMKHIMSLMKDVFTKVFIFAPTNEDNHDFDGIVPDQLIFEEFTCEDIKKIYNSQKAAASIYNRANNLSILDAIFKRVCTQSEEKRITSLDNAYAAKISRLSERDKKGELGKYIDDVYKDRKTSIYKKVVAANCEKLSGLSGLTKDEKYCIKYMNYNPRILVVFDDAINELTTLMKIKKEGDIIKDFFFKGRHAYITHFYTFQDETNINTSIKKNAFVSIFTDSNVARGFFTKASTNFGAQDKARAAAAIDIIFPTSDVDSDKKNNKLLFTRLGSNRFQCIRAAGDYKNFRMCSRWTWEFCETVKKKQDDIDKNNPYLKGYDQNL
jgi:hypothetical protein